MPPSAWGPITAAEVAAACEGVGRLTAPQYTVYLTWTLYMLRSAQPNTWIRHQITLKANKIIIGYYFMLALESW